ncbi:uncharacterized protein LOC127806527 isoform X2 [Diospyros lotus]|uniref:uncharacterized protein LOC127806527 isoform X2 n=1 Tax=Diospyros lotus TaxID=55363 RepID=UPI002257189A|nr:uncharacterized protein LOC127806527 isoform X2 [Diospyros lotus]
MEAVKLHLSNKSSEEDEYLLVLELSEGDPFIGKKKKLLEDNGLHPQGHVYLKNSSCSNLLNSTLKLLLQSARIVCLDEIELYFSEVDGNSSMRFHNPRIELEALHTVLSLINKALSSGSDTVRDILQTLRDSAINMIRELGDKVRLETRITTNHSCDYEKRLLHWAESNGVRTKLEVAYIEGAGRGAIATEDLKVGDIALEIPVSVIISEELVYQSDMELLLLQELTEVTKFNLENRRIHFPILENIDGISLETMLLLWSMKEKHNNNSKFRFYFDPLPEVFNTGLSFGINAIMALDGTLLLEEIVHAKEHLRTQYDELFPALCNDHPDIFPAELYMWEQFLWACELWYSNGMKVIFPDGKLHTCLVPVAGFLNHSLCPHILHYGKVDLATNSLKFPISRPCDAGEQCYLSYGKFSSSHLVTFYGFLPGEDNPYDVIPLDLDAADTDCSSSSCPMPNWTNHMIRGTWMSKNQRIFHYGLPPPLLDHFRKAGSPMCQTDKHERLENELFVLESLHSTFQDMLETLDDTNLEDSTNSSSWDVKLGVEFRNIQRKIVSSIVDSCNSGFQLVEHELSKYKA